MNEVVNLLKNTKTEDLNKRKRIDSDMVKLLLCLGAVFLAFFIVFGMVFSSIFYKRLYWDFVGELSQSTVYAFENEGATVEIEDKTFVIKDSKVYVFYKRLSIADFGKKQTGFVEEEESIRITFGDGSSLRMWQAPEKVKKKLLYVQYTNSRGRDYKCNVEGMTLEDWKTFVYENAR